MFERPLVRVLRKRLREPRRFMQIVLGPRQVGKTTIVRQALSTLKQPSIMIAADDLGVIGSTWLIEHWEQARAKATVSRACVLVVDEIQKLPNWSELVKRLWDEDTAAGTNVVVVLTGSPTLLLRKGLSESLAGRFEVLRAPHWSWSEMHDAFGIGFNEFLSVGGYPGPTALRKDTERWLSYMKESIIESTLSLDVLQLERIDKPALLRNVFMLGTSLSSKIVSLQKLLGQLQDAGNAATITHYLEVLRDAGLLCGLQKYAGTHVRKRSASPKLQSTAPALFSAVHGKPALSRVHDKLFYARAVESAVGSHLLAITASTPAEVFYWRDGDDEVDFVLATPAKRVLIEVKSGDSHDAFSGASAFRSHHGDAPLIVVGSSDHPIESVLSYTLTDFL